MWNVIEQFAHDVRYALRTMAANPVFAVMAALSLALGIGTNTAIFSFMESILLRALPVPHPETLVLFDWHSKDYPAVAHSFNGDNWLDPKGGMISGNFPYPAYEALRANNTAFSSVFAFNQAGRLTLQIRDQADLANGLYVAGGFFGGIGLPPTAGRLIDDRDDRPEACSVAVISHRYASSHFGEIDKIPGQTVLINNVHFLVIGVTAPEFYGIDHGDTVDVYLPMRANDLLQQRIRNPNPTKYLDNNFYWVQFMGRLRPGISLAQAQVALAPVFHQWVGATAKSDKERADLPALLLHEGAGGLEILRNQYAKPLYVLMTLVGLILAIACANVANLLLARAAARRREIAVRLSIGASRPRIIRQLLTESVLLACLGGALGLIFARWGIRLLTILIANGQDNFTLRAQINWHVLGATIALSLATGLFFGLVPALQATNVDLTTALKQTRAGASGMSPRRTFLRISLSQILVVSQITISVLLLVAAGLFVRTLANLHSIELGFNRENLLMFKINARQAGYEKERLAQFYEDLHARVAAIPGARRVTESSYALVSQSMWRTGIEIPGAVQSKPPSTAYISVGPSFLATMQIPVLLGHDISEHEVATDAHVAVVNERFVKSYFGAESPLGRHFKLGRGKNATDLEIIGVAKNVRYNSLKQDIPELAYVPYSQDLEALRGLTFEVRTAGDPLALTTEVRRVLRDADARIPLSNVTTQTRIIEQTIGQEQTFATLCTCFAVLALVIACVGLHGSMAYNVACRTSEIGIRMALGAERPRLIWMILREVLLLSMVGLAIGLPLALAASDIVKSFLFGIQPHDPLTLTLAAVILLVAAAMAGWSPAWRASRIDPIQALRQE